MELKGNTYFEMPYIKGQFEAWDGLMASGKLGGDPSKAVLAQAYLRKHLLQWLKDNQDLDTYKNNTSKLENDFIKEFDQHIMFLKRTGEFGMLFGKGTVVQTGKSALETLEAKIKKAQEEKIDEKDEAAQKIIDMTLDLERLSSVEFHQKYKMTKQTFKKKHGIE